MGAWTIVRMKRGRAPAVLVGLALLLCATGVAAQERTGRVVGVTDGDTITMLLNGHPTTVRLQGIDAPEKRQAFGQRAKQFAAALAFGKTVTIRATGRDRYGRLLAEVVLPDGRDLNRELVRAGYAWWFQRYSRDPALARLEIEAREARRGLWADPRPMPPWEYRQRRGVVRVGS